MYNLSGFVNLPCSLSSSIKGVLYLVSMVVAGLMVGSLDILMESFNFILVMDLEISGYQARFKLRFLLVECSQTWKTYFGDAFCEVVMGSIVFRVALCEVGLILNGRLCVSLSVLKKHNILRKGQVAGGRYGKSNFRGGRLCHGCQEGA